MKKTLAICFAVLSICLLCTACGPKELADGTYRVQVTLTGGSGRASVESPARVEVSGKTCTATLVWSSPYYVYMIADNIRYEPIQEQGNAVFEIPVVLDKDMPVSACTIAMSEPHVVDYVLHFDRSTAKGESK